MYKRRKDVFKPQKPNKNGIPDRWLNYTNIGKPIQGTPFVAFKVPLKKELCRQLTEGDAVFSPHTLVRRGPKLKLVIDLTNTYRYYEPRAFATVGVNHRKIKCPGHVVPPEYVVESFFKAVDEFIAFKTAYLPDVKGGYIGVHCTHGVNRTGYLICSYMIQKLGFPPEAAIASFEAARGHQIERINYLEALRSMKT